MRPWRPAACAAVLCAATYASAQSPQSKIPSIEKQFGSDARFVWTPEAISRISRSFEQPAWKAAVNSERPRGGVEVYAKVAPAVVVVRTDNGHGTGFIVSADGLVLTNYHVIAEGLRHDSKRSASYALVHMGRMGADGAMQLLPEPVRASLLKVDRVLDLALLKLDTIPAASSPLRFLQFADASPPPGSGATIVGHPASGLLWTLRSGQVSGIGRMPADLVDFVMLQLASAQAERQQVADELSRMDSRRIMLTSTGANPGDSGGPVVDGLGRVIAVTFAVPSDPARAKFSYHVHLDEVRQFMKGIPSAPMLLVPDPWELGPRVQLEDVDRDGAPDVLFAGTEAPEVMLFDLDNDTPVALRKSVDTLVKSRKWDFEFALRLVRSEPTSTAFYDSDNDGTVDLVDVVEDRDRTKNKRFTRTAAGGWRVEENVAMTFPSPSSMKDPRLAQRIRTMIPQK